MLSFIFSLFTGFIFRGLFFGITGWCIWTYYWNIHVPKATSFKFFRWLRSIIIERTAAMVVLSLTVTIGYIGFFSRVLDLATALTATLVIGIAETITILTVISKNKMSGKQMKKVRGPLAISFILLLFLGMSASAFFFSFAQYLATMTTFLVIMLPTVLFIIMAYKIYKFINKEKAPKKRNKAISILASERSMT